MPHATDRVTDATLSSLPGAVMLWHTRRLLIWALGSGVVYSIVTGSSRSNCPGGFTGDGGYLDGYGQPTDVAPTCTTISLQPSPAVFIAIVVLVLLTLTRVLQRASAESEAIRSLNRARIAIVWIVIASAAIAHLGFWSIPMTETGFGSSKVLVLVGGVRTDTYPIDGV
ncbi:hypothetical protein ACFQ58_13760 [Agromyces sp. NPDC056523]|uniref:hypothetical protein n=1 Tax=Agromyces sp. NPDC056523 TaxID=3345850 RepID=UPI0036721D9C